jgi:hypothetical protein
MYLDFQNQKNKTMINKIDNPDKKISTFRFENFFNVYNDSNGYNFYNILKSINIISFDDKDIEDEYIVKNNDTWYYISYKYYNTMDLWWLVCEYNQIKNPTKIPEVGTKLKLLKSQYVYPVILELKNQLDR